MPVGFRFNRSFRIDSWIVLSDGFIEGLKSDIHGDFPSTKLPFNNQYNYWEDSDLEDCSDNEQEALGTLDSGGSMILGKEPTGPASQATPDADMETSISEKVHYTRLQHPVFTHRLISGEGCPHPRQTWT